MGHVYFKQYIISRIKNLKGETSNITIPWFSVKFTHLL